MFKLKSIIQFMLPVLHFDTGGGGGGNSNPNQTTTSYNAVSSYAAPYVEGMLGKAQALTDANMNYQPYSGQRTADFTGMQNQAFNAAGNLGTAQQTTDASNMAAQTGIAALNTNYGGQQFGNTYQGMQPYDPGQYNQQSVSAPNLNMYQMNAPQNVQGAQAEAAQTGYQPSLNTYQMNGPQNVRAQNFNDRTAAQYMSPYIQQSLAPQLAEMQRQYGITGAQQQSNATQAGAFGGSREAIMAAENERNKNTAMNQAIGTGMQNAYTNAQSQFNADQARQLQAQQSNQGAGLTTGQANLNAALGVQGLGAQYGSQMALANLGNQQQSNLQNAQLSQQANLANQQAGLTAGQANLNAAMGIQSLGAGQNLAAQQSNQQTNLATQQAQQQANQYGYGQGMQNAQNQAQYGLGANQLNAQQQQFGANLGLQGLQTANAAAGTLGNLGQNQYAQNTGNINLQNQLGTQQQQQQQNVLNQQYQDFLTQKQNPYTQLSYMQSMMSGLPMTSTTQNVYSNPSMLSQVAGLGTAAAGAYGMSRPGGAAGGLPKDFKKTSKRPAGLAELALSKMA
jgi:hypothetical protein